MTWLTLLYAEQTTPNDIIVFLFLGTLCTLAIAVAAYSIVLIILWQLRYKTEHELKVLLLPTLRNIRSNLGDYVLATLTALLLLFTVSAKHDVVDQILDGDLTAIDHETAVEVFPFKDVTLAPGQQGGPEFEQFTSWARGQVVETISVKAAEMIRPLLQNNFVEGANLITRALTEKTEFSQSADSDKRWILALAAGLLVGYVLWLGWRRWNRIDTDQKTLNYADVIKRLSAPAVCIPLVLISALELGDSEHLAASAMAVMAVDDEPETPLGAAIDQLAQTTLGPRLFRSVGDVEMNKGLVDQQLAQLKGHEVWLQDHDRAIGGLAGELAILQQQISTLAALDPRVSRLESRMDAMDGRIEGVDSLSGELARLKGDVETLERQVDERINSVVSLANRAMSATGALDSRVSLVEQNVKRLSDTGKVPTKGLLLIRDTSGMGGNYSVRDSRGRPVSGATGSIIGIHLLAPGTYTAIGTNNRSLPVTVRADSARVAVIARTVARFSTGTAAPVEGSADDVGPE